MNYQTFKVHARSNVGRQLKADLVDILIDWGHYKEGNYLKRRSKQQPLAVLIEEYFGIAARWDYELNEPVYYALNQEAYEMLLLRLPSVEDISTEDDLA